MHRHLAALAAVLACLALAAPAAAQEPTISVTTTCGSNNQTMIQVNVTGLNPGVSAGFIVVDADGQAVTNATGSDTTTADGSYAASWGTGMERGTYTMYAYTGPYQTVGSADSWPGAIHVDTFHPELTTSWVSTQFEVTCGPPTQEECKFGGFEGFGYKNQGQCVSASAPGRT